MSDWNGDWFPLPGQAVFGEQQQVAALSRAPGNLDLFVIGYDHHIWSTFWTEGGGWNADWFPLPGQAVFGEQQQVAAVSRAPGNLDLFVIGYDHHIWSTFWTEGGGWNADWFPLPGQAVFGEQQQVAAVSRAPGNLDLFVIGYDHHIWSTFWTEGGGWNADWFPLPGQAVFGEQQQVAAVPRAPGNLDLFVIGYDHHIWSTFWTEGGGWNADWFPLPGQAVFGEQQQVAAVSRAPGNLDLFVIGYDHHIWSTFWTEGGGWNADWFPLPGQAVFGEQQQVAAVSRAPGNLDLFVIGYDHHIWSTFWTEGGGWNADWFPLPGQAVFGEQQQVAAVSRAPGNLDLFVIGYDHHIWSTFWTWKWNRLQLRLRGFSEIESTDNFLQGASDEVYLSAISTDSAAAVVGPDGKPSIDVIQSGRIGDVSDDEVRGPWQQNPYVLVEFNLNRPASRPRTFSVTWLIVEEDSEDLAKAFNRLYEQVGGEVRQAAVTAVAATVGGIAGGAIGSVIMLPGIGTAIGAAVGALAGAAFDGIIDTIREGLDNEVFTPRTIILEVPAAEDLGNHPVVGTLQTLDIEERGAKYVIEYDWHLA
ncbi:hypothetical protein QF031_002295 [Pseudarthrobacter defluvii]|uniref:hypothetical protein n=1 Tax=Pseudarthrobacter defluvii TaxID=410837 RepID=UPI002780667F|nr:hypothetical protein [Pseudarthrobacter defluvii]MDQ0769546.1 hypothetical protein [Pseudarthrobacter defluvii]